MALVLTKTKIISQASIILGNGVVDTLNDPNEFVRAASEFYDLLLPSLLSANNWRFSTGIQELSKLVDTPIVPRWSTVFQLPAGYLAMVRVYPNSPFQIYEDVIFSNQTELKGEFRFQPDESKFPAYFVEYLVYALAENLALAIALRDDYATVLKRKMIESQSRAIWADSQSHYQDEFTNFPIITSRGDFGDSFPSITVGS